MKDRSECLSDRHQTSSAEYSATVSKKTYKTTAMNINASQEYMQKKEDGP